MPNFLFVYAITFAHTCPEFQDENISCSGEAFSLSIVKTRAQFIEVLRAFAQSLRANAGIVPRLRHYRYISNSNSLVILQFDVMYSSYRQRRQIAHKYDDLLVWALDSIFLALYCVLVNIFLYGHYIQMPKY
jgi:hypothetical protein